MPARSIPAIPTLPFFLLPWDARTHDGIDRSRIIVEQWCVSRSASTWLQNRLTCSRSHEGLHSMRTTLAFVLYWRI